MHVLLQGLIYIAAGSALGGATRYFVSGLVGRAVGETFPWGTLTVNLTGAFVIGIASALAAADLLAQDQWQWAVTGFLGSYTTVSSFSLQTLALLRDGEWPRAMGNVVGSLFLCLAAAAIGFHVGSIYPGGGA